MLVKIKFDYKAKNKMNTLMKQRKKHIASLYKKFR